MSIFRNQMMFYAASDAIWCRVFSTSLTGDALEWFFDLPSHNIDCFCTLKAKFRAQFVASRTVALTLMAFVNIRQGKDKSLRNFMERFNNVSMKTKNLLPEVAMHHLVTLVKAEPFADKLSKKPAKRTN